MTANASQITIRATVKVAAIQSPSIFGNVNANIKLFTQQIEKAAAQGAKIIVLPEAAITGYASQDFEHSWCTKQKSEHLGVKFTAHDPYHTAQNMDSEMIQYFMSLCKKLQIYLTVPYVEKVKNPNFIDADSKHNDVSASEKPIMEDEDIEFLYYNSITLLNPDGKKCGHYRKTNLWPAYDHSWATEGDKIVTVETEYGKIGLGICFDIHKILPQYKEQNIWALLYCIAWVSKVAIYPDDECTFRWFNMQLPNRMKKLEIPYYVIGCNWSIDSVRKDNEFLKNDCKISTQKHKLKWTGFGFSTIYGPRGRIMKQSAYKNRFDNDIVYADIPYQTPNTVK